MLVAKTITKDHRRLHLLQAVSDIFFFTSTQKSA